MKHSGGRPTKYDASMIDELLKYFDIEPHFETPITITDKKGNTIEKIAFIPSDLPTIAGFCKLMKIHRDTLNEWTRIYPEFSDSVKKAKVYQEHILVTNALRGEYNPAFAIFFTKNNIKNEDGRNWSDRQDITTDGDKIGGPIVYLPKEEDGE